MRYLSELAGGRPGTGIRVGSPSETAWFRKEKKKVHLFALGDVGSVLLTGLVLQGADCISEIGLYDVREHVCDRYEFEMGQVLDSAGRTQTVPVRVLTEREQIAQFRIEMIPLTYDQLKANPMQYQGSKFTFRGKVMEYTDYNGEPCALVCVSNPNTGVWRDPVYAVVKPEEAPQVGEIMTFYLAGEGITLPASGSYTASGEQEEVPVARAAFVTTNR